MMFPVILFAFIILPILEIVVFLLVAQEIGWINAIMMIILFCFIGWSLFKLHLLNRPSDIPHLLKKGYRPHELIWESFLKWMALFLLIFPGFISEILGVLLLLSPIRFLLILCTRVPLIQKMFGLSTAALFRNGSSGMNFQQMAEMFRQNARFHEDEMYTNEGEYEGTSGGRTVEFPEYPSATPTSASSAGNDDIIDVEYEIKSSQSRGQ